jgi:hypothetical protein
MAVEVNIVYGFIPKIPLFFQSQGSQRTLINERNSALVIFSFSLENMEEYINIFDDILCMGGIITKPVVVTVAIAGIVATFANGMAQPPDRGPRKPDQDPQPESEQKKVDQEPQPASEQKKGRPGAST